MVNNGYYLILYKFYKIYKSQYLFLSDNKLQLTKIVYNIRILKF